MDRQARLCVLLTAQAVISHASSTERDACTPGRTRSGCFVHAKKCSMGASATGGPIPTHSPPGRAGSAASIIWVVETTACYGCWWECRRRCSPSDFTTLDVEAYLAPFLAVVRSEVTTGPITGVALASIHKFLVYGIIGRYDHSIV